MIAIPMDLDAVFRLDRLLLKMGMWKADKKVKSDTADDAVVATMEDEDTSTAQVFCQ